MRVKSPDLLHYNTQLQNDLPQGAIPLSPHVGPKKGALRQSSTNITTKVKPKSKCSFLTFENMNISN